MDRAFKSALAAYLEEALPAAAPGFSLRKLDRHERSRYAGAPIAFFSRRTDHEEQFIAFLPAKGGSRFLVECGWFAGPPVPLASVEAATLVRASDRRDIDSARQFAVRLFWLCADRGNAEHFWDLFSPEVWVPGAESFREFSARQAFAATDEALRVFSNGGVSAEYARDKALLVGGDCLRCIEQWAVPFLAGRKNGVRDTSTPEASR